MICRPVIVWSWGENILTCLPLTEAGRPTRRPTRARSLLSLSPSLSLNALPQVEALTTHLQLITRAAQRCTASKVRLC